MLSLVEHEKSFITSGPGVEEKKKSTVLHSKYLLICTNEVHVLSYWPS